MFFIFILIEYKSLDLIYLNVMSKLIREKFTKIMFFYLCAADLFKFNEEYSIAAINQAH